MIFVKKSPSAIVGMELAANEIAFVAGGHSFATHSFGGSGGSTSSLEMSMLDLQSLVSRRSTMLQETSEMMSGMASTAGTIASNVKG